MTNPKDSQEQARQLLKLDADDLLNNIKRLLDSRQGLEDLEKVLSRYVEIEVALKTRLPTRSDHMSYLKDPHILDGLVELIRYRSESGYSLTSSSGSGAFSRGFVQEKYIQTKCHLVMKITYDNPSRDYLVNCASRDEIQHEPVPWYEWVDHEHARGAFVPGEREFVLLELREQVKMSPVLLGRQMGLRPTTLKEAIEFEAANPDGVFQKFKVQPVGPSCSRVVDQNGLRSLTFRMAFRTIPPQQGVTMYLFVNARPGEQSSPRP